MHGPLPEVTQSTIGHSKFVPPVSGLLSSVEAQTSAMDASTLVVFAAMLHSDSSPLPTCFTISIFVKHVNVLIYNSR